MEIITAFQAIQKNKKLYYTGKPCKFGFFAQRSVTTGECTCPQCELHMVEDENIIEGMDEPKPRKPKRANINKSRCNCCDAIVSTIELFEIDGEKLCANCVSGEFPVLVIDIEGI